MPTCPICKCTCQAAYKIGSQQTILSLRQQGKLKDETGRSALFPTVEERKRQANAARTLSDVFKNSIGAAIQNQIHEQLGPLAAIAALGVARHPSSASLHPSSNVARLPPLGGGVAGLCRSAGLELDSVRMQENMYTHAARSFVGRMKPDVSTHDTTMQGLGALLGNGTIVETSIGSSTAFTYTV